MAKTVGVLGGMGPDATVDFLTKVIALTPAATDQDHIRMLVDNNPGVPDRQAALTADGEDPGPVLVAMAQGLERSGADFLVMPCNTAHAWVDESVAACADYATVGLLSTAGCLESRVYQDGFAVAGKALVLPSDEELAEIMRLVYRVKGGDRDADVFAGMAACANALVARGAEVIVAACTEIPLVLDPVSIDVPVIMSTDVLAAATTARARA